MDKYDIILPNEKASTYRVVTLLVAVINVLIFGYSLFGDTTAFVKALVITGFLINSLAVIYFYFLKKGSDKLRIELAFLVTVIIWLMAEKYLIGIFLLAFAILGFYTNKKIKVSFSDHGIQYPSFPPKMIEWSEVEQVMLKDGMLTIDMKNNQLIQSVITPESSLAISEPDFNAYCSKMIVQPQILNP